MAEQTFAPYAPAKAVLGVVERFRDRGLPEPLTTGALEQVGVPASMAPEPCRRSVSLALWMKAAIGWRVSSSSAAPTLTSTPAS